MLETVGALKGNALMWFASYLHDITFAAEVGNFLSSSQSVLSGLPRFMSRPRFVFLIYAPSKTDLPETQCGVSLLR